MENSKLKKESKYIGQKKKKKVKKVSPYLKFIGGILGTTFGSELVQRCSIRTFCVSIRIVLLSSDIFLFSFLRKFQRRIVLLQENFILQKKKI